ncbi:hypothetical protein CWC16_18480 [Pseudoalteromonas sp. S3776]|uniref:acyltransferase family protein n=1 Tax=Pseudoalteromonas sp. S3776 TaxID=579544 RepID=UPI001109AD76|nr:acyltransferase family protein [Pseudoalteromonas sp. S3776]TMO76248.1 hypothetical protein CWC16_18480 [Pseudoalteromonas sp. S3776]
MSNLYKKPRLEWLDSLRGLAILFLIVIHYIGALESRDLLPSILVEYIQAIFRVATPLFITVFGFTIAYTYWGKVNSIQSFKALIAWSLRRLPKVLLAREVIVIIYSIAHQEQLDTLIETLLYSRFSIAGEILTFYFLAIFVTPYVLIAVYYVNSKIVIMVSSFLYLTAYLIGSFFGPSSEVMLLRLFFYDVYPFFPFFYCAIVGMLLAKLYVYLGSEKERFLVFFIISSILVLTGLSYFNSLTIDVLSSLAVAKFKAPPHPAYLSLYIGMSIMLALALAYVTEKGLIPIFVHRILSVLGRNSLTAYVLHYTLHFTPLISLYLIDKKSTLIELVSFISILLFCYCYILIKDIKDIKE